MDAFALLVGFAWEQCFDNSVDAVASSTGNPHVSKLVLSFFCAGLLIPAWKWYMLPYILKEGYKFSYVTSPSDLVTIFHELKEDDEEWNNKNHGESQTMHAIHNL